MREISPKVGMSVEEYLAIMPVVIRRKVEEIRRQKQADARRRPSTSLIDRSALITKEHRGKLLDKVAALVDENCCGRSDMCIQYADLLNRALTYLQFPSHAVLGTATYYSPDGNTLHEWAHTWVRVGEEVVDGNVDSIPENSMVPEAVRVAPYWGPIKQTPPDRKLRAKIGSRMPDDEDVNDIWWPDLKAWIDKDFR